MESDFFRDCNTLAGENGLGRKVQAVSLFDAPDGYKWIKGKEFIVSSGYLFQNDDVIFEDIILHLHKYNSAALGIKVSRFLNKIPDKVIKLCNNLNFPLIELPYDVPWIDIINAFNTIAMNRYILRINHIQRNISSLPSNLYSIKNIMNIINKLSNELEKPVIIFDLLDNSTCTSPENYFNDADISHTAIWEPSFKHKKEIICDQLKIYRIRNLENMKSSPWIVIPIHINEILIALLAVSELNEEIDYYDIFSIRLSFTLLQQIYEQKYIMSSIKGRLQDEFVEEIIQKDYRYTETLLKKAHDLHINVESNYVCICLKQYVQNIDLYECREVISQKVYMNFPKDKTIFGIIHKDKAVILYAVDKKEKFYSQELIDIEEKCKTLLLNLEKEILMSSFKCGISYSADRIFHIKKCYLESTQAIDIGIHVYSQKKILSYKKLGFIGLLDVESFQAGNVDYIFDEIKPLFQRIDSVELISTIKTYLECESNYKSAAEKLYIHSNTVRYRIEKIQKLCHINLEDPIERIKLELALKFLEKQNL